MINKTKTLPSKIFLFIVITVILTASVVLAKYITEKENEGLYIAENFYLESNMLSSSAETAPKYILKSDVDYITFDIMNYPDDLRVSEVNIDCKVLLTDSEGNVTGQDIKLQKNTRDKKTVIFDELDPGTYKVQVNSIFPYKDNLYGEFIVVGLDEDIKYTVSDSSGSPNLILKVTTNDYQGNIKITWPVDVYPDTTDPLFKNASGTSTVIEMKANSEYSFQFFKKKPANDYTNDIKVQKGN